MVILTDFRLKTLILASQDPNKTLTTYYEWYALFDIILCMVYNTVRLISEGVKNMQNILYKIILYKMINLLDDIVDSGNMILAQYIFLLFTAISFFAAVTLSEVFLL
jgi:hypothetical protein